MAVWSSLNFPLSKSGHILESLKGCGSVKFKAAIALRAGGLTEMPTDRSAPLYSIASLSMCKESEA